MAKVIMPIPSRDFDPTEAAGSWLMLTKAGHVVEFATPDGKPGAADDMMVTGEGLDFWGFIPGLRKFKVVGRILANDKNGRAAYQQMIQSPQFQSPKRWEEITAADYDGLLLPGGHRARGMREYLESPVLQKLVVDFFHTNKPVAAICHGALLTARSIDPGTGKSVLYGRKTTSLTWPLERKGWMVGKIVRFWDPDYYRTYPDGPGKPVGYMSVEQEIKRLLANPSDFEDVPKTSSNYKQQTDGQHRDTEGNEKPAFVVTDGNYLSARWPGDAFTFGKKFAIILSKV